jgi:MoaA/NifB/PqqE/SkfB family radical SAM enzyme
VQILGYTEIHLQTNGIRLSKIEFAELLYELNVKLFIISLHGSVEEIHDKLTMTKGGFAKTVQGVNNVKKLGARVRTNTVITSQNYKDLSEIVKLAQSLSVDHVNISNMHPTGSAYFGFDCLAVSFELMQPFLYRALDYAEKFGVLTTLEGFPYCTIKEKLNLHLNEHDRDIKMLMRGQTLNDYDEFMNEACRVYGPPCVSCSARKPCGGVYREYVEFRGWSEFNPLP